MTPRTTRSAPTQDRVDAFQGWIIIEQNKSRIPQTQRLLVQELASAGTTKTIGGPSAGLPVFVGVVVFLIFCGIAILLDRPRPDKDEKDKKPPKQQQPSAAARLLPPRRSRRA